MSCHSFPARGISSIPSSSRCSKKYLNFQHLIACTNDPINISASTTFETCAILTCHGNAAYSTSNCLMILSPLQLQSDLCCSFREQLLVLTSHLGRARSERVMDACFYWIASISNKLKSTILGSGETSLVQGRTLRLVSASIMASEVKLRLVKVQSK